MSGQIESIYYDFPMSADKQNLNTPIVLPRSGGDYLFNAVLQPNSSLKPRGFLILMIAIVAVSGVAGIAFMLIGAWPVLGFFGLDLALIYFAFKANYRWASLQETVRLKKDSLIIERISPSGKLQRWRFQPYWLKVYIDTPVKHDSQLVLSSHGKCLKIGEFLAPEERVELANALKGALRMLRQPEHLRDSH